MEIPGSYDAVVVGSGPNGLAAAIRLAQRKLSVLVVEASETIGGGARSGELTLPGFTHDLCSAVHPLGIGSPFFTSIGLEKFGLRWIQPELPVAHPLDNGLASALYREVTTTADALGRDAPAYRRLMSPLVANWQNLCAEFLQPMLHFPSHPFQMARFGLEGIRPAAGLVNWWFREAPARALFAGLAAHSFLPMEDMGSAAFGLVLGMAGHAVGWPIPRGGSQKISDALAACLLSLGGEIRTSRRIESLAQLPKARAILFDVTPRQLLRIAGEKLSARYRRRLEKFHYGPGIFKIDYALDGPIPWTAAACRRAGTVHVCGTFEEVATAEREAVDGKIPQRPFVLLAQPSLFDPTRCPAGRHIAWAYCHVPNGSTVDVTAQIEDQIERFAPGFRQRVLARHTLNCAQLEMKNPNLIGGSITGGENNLWQLIARPIFSRSPYRIPGSNLYLCSASTPPGGGVHGMCGFHAAEAAIGDFFK
ncbi:MAG TPA: NAD(P)/FAD-dependent oxidoreductase [Verrucomicrobiae bacterium]